MRARMHAVYLALGRIPNGHRKVKSDDLLHRIDGLLALGGAALATRYSHEGSSQQFLRDEEVATFRSAGLSFLAKTVRVDHPYYVDFEKHSGAGWPSSIQAAVGTLKALENEIEAGWFTSVRGLVSAEIFSDFVEMAEHLLESGYKDPAAVLLGGVLEERLRELAVSAGINVTVERNGREVPRKADSLNSDLAKVGEYNLLQQKTITAWLDLRNNAAHGEYEAYSGDQVANFLDGLRHFLIVTTR